MKKYKARCPQTAKAITRNGEYPYNIKTGDIFILAEETPHNMVRLESTNIHYIYVTKPQFYENGLYKKKKVKMEVIKGKEYKSKVHKVFLSVNGQITIVNENDILTVLIRKKYLFKKKYKIVFKNSMGDIVELDEQDFIKLL